MAVFNALIQIYLILIGVNLILGFLLWKATRFKPFLSLALYWLFLFIAYFLQKAAAGEEPVIRTLVIAIPNFVGHYLLVSVLGTILSIPVPLKKFGFIPIVTMPIVVILNFMKAPPVALVLPSIIGHSLLYFYVVYKAYRYRREQLTFSLKALCVLFVLYALHLYDYAFLYLNLELLSIGFTIAIVFSISFAILFPAAMIERISQEKARLEIEMEYKAKLMQASKMAALGEMAGGVAHEINNPLAIIGLLMENMRVSAEDGTLSSEEVVRDAKQVDTIVQRIGKITRALRMVAGEHGDIKKQKNDITEILRETLSICMDRVREAQISFQLKGAADSHFVLCNANEISQILINLINNAIDAVQIFEKKEIVVSVSEQSTNIVISVEDSGKIPAEVADRIMEPFFTTKPVGMGTGLGLSVSRSIAEEHGGHLYLDKTSENTRFVLELPKLEEPNSAG